MKHLSLQRFLASVVRLWNWFLICGCISKMQICMLRSTFVLHWALIALQYIGARVGKCLGVLNALVLLSVGCPTPGEALT